MKVLAKPLGVSISNEQLFLLSSLLVNGGNYLYNLLLGRFLEPGAFADAALLITLLLVLSFAAMTFQLATAKFSVEYEKAFLNRFITWIYKKALIIGVTTGALIILFADHLQQVLHTQSSYMFVLFGVSIPFYFVMSVNRGRYQGQKNYLKLSITYQIEMLSRLFLTFLFLFFLPSYPSFSIAMGLLVSVVLGMFPLERIKWNVKSFLPKKEKQIVSKFILITAVYECTLILCNNSDIILVKHFFPSFEAGLYASLALIGRVVYFVTWMFVMILLPEVIEKRKKGIDTLPVLFKNLAMVGGISALIVCITFLIPETIIHTLFGSNYISIAPLLGYYALATGLFAIANIFAYYFLSLSNYIPVIATFIAGILQIVLIGYYHNSLQQVVFIQIYIMSGLLFLQIVHCLFKSRKRTLS